MKNETIAVIGYGIQGAAQASNMRDSGLKVIVGLREGGATWDKAKREGHKVTTVADAVKKADIVHVLIPDMQQATVYKKEIAPNLRDGRGSVLLTRGGDLLEVDRASQGGRRDNAGSKGPRPERAPDLPGELRHTGACGG